MLLAFDLDGTISDPSLGITSCINKTLEIMGKPTLLPKQLYYYIGPPVEMIFEELLDTKSNEEIEKARFLFGDFYRNKGYKENHLYQGIEELLGELKQQGHELVIVTSKSQRGAQKIAELFDLFRFFKAVYGRVDDCSKTLSLQRAMGESVSGPAIMIGDRLYDIEAAQNCGCISIGVSWGFGTLEELEQARADYIATSLKQLKDIIYRISKVNN